MFSFDEFTKVPCIGMYKEKEREIPIIEKVDLLIVGGSPSGFTAAIAAARHGVRVLIVERFGFLGGQSVYSMVVQWEKRAFIDNLGGVFTKGLPKEILDAVVAKGDSDGLWNEPPGCPEMRDGEEWLNPEAIKTTFYEMCEKEGVRILLHTMAVDAIVELKNDGIPRLSGVIFENKSGRFAIKAKLIIDATADLDIIWKAIGAEGCAVRDPKERLGQGFYVWYGNVDSEKYIEWYLKQEDTMGGYPNPRKYPEKVRKHLKEQKLILVRGTALKQFVKQAENEGIFQKIETMLEELEIAVPVTLEMKWVGRDRWCLYLLGIPNLNMLDIWQLTKFEIFRQKLAYYLLPVVRKIPGWENCYISREAMHMGSRETRVLKAVKIIDQNLIWDPENATKPTPINTIGRSGGHDPGKNFVRAGYPIPYEMFIPEKLDGVLICARAAGTKFDRALDAHRGITPNMVIGQGIGTSAALCIKTQAEPRNLNIHLLHETLRKDGVQLDHESMDFPFEIDKSRIRVKPRKSE